MEAKRLDNLSIQEYIEIEQASDTKHEYHDGTIFAMAGGTVAHGLISGNMLIELGIAIRNKGSNCRPINSDVKLKIETLNKYLYPDAMVVCGNIEKSADQSEAILNPTVIIEVLSKSTEGYDRGDKFFFYKQIVSLNEYLLIDQYHAIVDIYTRKTDLWKITRVQGLDKSVLIPSLDVDIKMSDIYRDVF